MCSKDLQSLGLQGEMMRDLLKSVSNEIRLMLTAMNSDKLNNQIYFEK